MRRAAKRRPPTRAQRDLFLEACAALARLTDDGFEIYVAGSGSVCLMVGPTHTHDGRQALRDNVALTASVPGMSGGEW